MMLCIEKSKLIMEGLKKNKVMIITFGSDTPPP